MANSLLYATQIASGNISRWKRIPDEFEIDEADEEPEAKEPIMLKILREALADLKSSAVPMTAGLRARCSPANFRK